MSKEEIEYLTVEVSRPSLRKILEWGSGGSTLYFPKYTKAQWITVEHDPQWASKVIADGIGENVTLILLKEKEAYVNTPIDLGPFDMIIVDGFSAWRTACMLAAPRAMSNNGVLFLHDSSRTSYDAGYEPYDHIQIITSGTGKGLGLTACYLE